MLVFNINVRATNLQRIFFKIITNNRKYATSDLCGVLHVLLLVVQFVCVNFFNMIIFMSIFLPQTIYLTTEFFEKHVDSISSF